jgi:hypothetical protein
MALLGYLSWWRAHSRWHMVYVILLRQRAYIYMLWLGPPTLSLLPRIKLVDDNLPLPPRSSSVMYSGSVIHICSIFPLWSQELEFPLGTYTSPQEYMVLLFCLYIVDVNTPSEILIIMRYLRPIGCLLLCKRGVDGVGFLIIWWPRIYVNPQINLIYDQHSALGKWSGWVLMIFEFLTLPYWPPIRFICPPTCANQIMPPHHHPYRIRDALEGAYSFSQLPCIRMPRLRFRGLLPHIAYPISWWPMIEQMRVLAAMKIGSPASP